MRRLFIVFVLFGLSFQFAWGAAAAYCQHENAAGGGHFGHHSHVHKGKSAGHAGGASAEKKVSPLTDDPDCVMCHLGCVQLPLKSWMVALDVTTKGRFAPVTAHALSPPPGAIERPRWILAA